MKLQAKDMQQKAKGLQEKSKAGMDKLSSQAKAMAKDVRQEDEG